MSYSNASLPRKRIGAAAILLDSQRAVLIVKPTYRLGWLTPGGTVEEDESPYEACGREVREELGLDVTIGRLLAVGYRPAHQDKVENIQFVFWGGELTDQQISSIRLPAGELDEFRFCERDDLGQFLNAHLANRCRLALEALELETIAYEEDMRSR